MDQSTCETREQMQGTAPCRPSWKASKHACLCCEVCWKGVRYLRPAMSCHHSGNTLQEVCTRSAQCCPPRPLPSSELPLLRFSSGAHHNVCKVARGKMFYLRSDPRQLQRVGIQTLILKTVHTSGMPMPKLTIVCGFEISSMAR